MKELAIALCLLTSLALIPLGEDRSGLTVGSKNFTESIVIGELLKQLAESSGVPVTHTREVGGTRVVFQALINGDIDIYAEYTGTLSEEILAHGEVGASVPVSDGAIRRELSTRGIGMSQPLGFNNSYALGMKRARAAQLGVQSISDLARHPNLKLGFSNEFMDRQDGWHNLQKLYDLPHRNVKGMDHEIAYEQVRLGTLDVLDAYTTDAKIASNDLVLLRDDKAYFPRYDAVLLYRTDSMERFPAAAQAILRLVGALDENWMRHANAEVELRRHSEAKVAAEFSRQRFGLSPRVHEESRGRRIFDRTVEHLDLLRRSLIPAIFVAVPLGIIAAKRRRTGQIMLAVAGIVQTVPSLALLVVLMPLVAALGLPSAGLGSATAVLALFLYSLLPVVRSTHAGLTGLSREHIETALALGLPAWVRLLRIELPLAAGSIVSGIQTAAVQNVGFATLGSLVGAGGYGQAIISGVRLNDTGLILEGAIPAALLALVVQAVFELLARRAMRGMSKS